MSHQPRRGLARSLVGALATVAVLATGLAAVGQAQAAPPTKTDATPSPAAKIKPELMAKLEGKDAKASSDYWVRFGAKADLTAASNITDWNERGTAVAAALRKTAADSQAKIRAELDAQHVKYTSFWGTNAIRINSGSLALAQNLATHTEVEGLYAPVAIEVPKVTKGTTEHEINSVEWGVANINADDVWSQYGDKGEGIVVASIDTGVQFDHPALVGKYRGNNGDGTFDHNYNWFDAAGTCAGPRRATTTATAPTRWAPWSATTARATRSASRPGVKWIAANGCCPSDAALIASGQWMLAPTEPRRARTPTSSKRPNIINNSWGIADPSQRPVHGGHRRWPGPRPGIFGTLVQRQQRPGLPHQRLAGQPDQQLLGRRLRHQQQHRRRSPPAAPVRTARSSRTSRPPASTSGPACPATPTAASTAPRWPHRTSRARSRCCGPPRRRWSVTSTPPAHCSTTPPSTAPDSQCGGTADDNNVFGEGRLDALALLNAAPIGDTGTLAGTVTDATAGAPIAGAERDADGGRPARRVLTTGADGTYSTRLLPAGDYDRRPSRRSGTQTQTATVDSHHRRDHHRRTSRWTALPQVTVSGTVTDGSGHGWPLYAKVTVEGPGRRVRLHHARATAATA